MHLVEGFTRPVFSSRDVDLALVTPFPKYILVRGIPPSRRCNRRLELVILLGYLFRQTTLYKVLPINTAEKERVRDRQYYAGYRYSSNSRARAVYSIDR